MKREKYQHLIRVIDDLSKKEKFWAVIADNLKKSRRRRRVINLYELNRITSPNEKVFVVGKVLGNGVLRHPLLVVAFDFSEKSYHKVKMAGGYPIYLEDFIKEKTTVSGFKIIR